MSTAPHEIIEPQEVEIIEPRDVEILEPQEIENTR